MTRQEAEQLIRERGFRIWAILGEREFQAMDEGGINLFVDWGRIISVWPGWYQGLSFK